MNILKLKTLCLYLGKANYFNLLSKLKKKYIFKNKKEIYEEFYKILMYT